MPIEIRRSDGTLVKGLAPKGVLFISQKFVPWKDGVTEDTKSRYRRIIEEVKAAARAAEWYYLEALPSPDVKASIREVQVKLWRGDALIAVAFNEEELAQLSESQAHEVGYYQALQRPLKVLTNNRGITRALFSNISGQSVLPAVDGDLAFVRDEERSIFKLTKGWLDSIVLEATQDWHSILPSGRTRTHRLQRRRLKKQGDGRDSQDVANGLDQ